MKKTEKSTKLVLSATTVTRLQQNLTAEQLADAAGAKRPSSIKYTWIEQC